MYKLEGRIVKRSHLLNHAAIERIYFLLCKTLDYFDVSLSKDVKITAAVGRTTGTNMSDFGFYFRMGWEHIISPGALDHQLFIAALAAIYLLRDWKQVLILVTAFTIGHSLTLALSVLDLFRFPAKWVEFLIPLTIVITAISNLFQKKFTSRSVRVNYFLALFFGLIHGMGFANTIRFMLAGDQSLGWSLLGFNLGLEVGQIIFVTIILLVSLTIVTLFKVNRREWVIFLSAGTLALALKMALERIP